MASAAAAQRPGAARAAAKQRRQTVMLIVLAAVLAALLAWQLPQLLDRSSASTPSAAPVAAAPTRPTNSEYKGAGGDPFAGNPLPNQDARPVKAGGADPFKGGGPTAVAEQPIPGQVIVVGQPGGHRVATHGWIVILASIPTRNGRASAVQFARGAGKRVGSVSILNSSNRRPLRGGYWVVYSGPYPTLAAVSRRSANVRAAGYDGAYIRELITYR